MLEWVEQAVSLDGGGVQELGRGLAMTHAAGAEPSARCRRRCAAAGFGSLRLPNGRAADWPSFYAERRLAPLAAIARERGALSKGPTGARRLCARMPS